MHLKKKEFIQLKKNYPLKIFHYYNNKKIFLNLTKFQNFRKISLSFYYPTNFSQSLASKG